ncbi:MAG: TOBE domain-containing protein, partial [Mobilicoccus sp.]|nr:TOBE domain-containing protein [Mobilicoccus sp.]
DRVAVLKDGVLQQCDSPRRMYDHPNNVFVAGFIGSPAMNLSVVDVVDGGVRFGSVVLPVEREVLAGAGDTVTLGVRPEDLSLTEGEGLTIEVDVVEELGADAYVYGHVAGTDPVEDRPFIARVDGRTPPQKGQSVTFTAQPAHVHLFHATNGERLGD